MKTRDALSRVFRGARLGPIIHERIQTIPDETLEPTSVPIHIHGDDGEAVTATHFPWRQHLVARPRARRRFIKPRRDREATRHSDGLGNEPPFHLRHRGIRLRRRRPPSLFPPHRGSRGDRLGQCCARCCAAVSRHSSLAEGADRTAFQSQTSTIGCQIVKFDVIASASGAHALHLIRVCLWGEPGTLRHSSLTSQAFRFPGTSPPSPGHEIRATR